uniref:Uncharacterized protein n=1 Tax=Rhizophora mucronata TaxID=61149 RepID=A0A2P2NYF0_RHIMU
MKPNPKISITGMTRAKESQCKVVLF